jgi:hypothetical protein
MKVNDVLKGKIISNVFIKNCKDKTIHLLSVEGAIKNYGVCDVRFASKSECYEITIYI